MGTVVIKCAATGLDFSVGIETDEISFGTLPDIRLKSRCPHCGNEHHWSTRQARLRVDFPFRTVRSAPSQAERMAAVSKR